MINELKSRDDWLEIRDQWLDGLCGITFLLDVATEFEIEQAFDILFDILVENQELDAPDLPTQESVRLVAIKLAQVFRTELDESSL
jgi:hypothetical protein